MKLPEVFTFFGTSPRLEERVRRDGETHTFGDPFVETFEFGWSKETTFDGYRERAAALITMATSSADHTELRAQACLQAAVVFLVSGLEVTLVWLHGQARSADSVPAQSLSEYQRYLAAFPAYKPIKDPDRTAIERLFKVRHAIVHAGSMASDVVSRARGRSFAIGQALVFAPSDVQKVLEACDRFASTIAVLDPGSISPAKPRRRRRFPARVVDRLRSWFLR